MTSGRATQMAGAFVVGAGLALAACGGGGVTARSLSAAPHGAGASTPPTVTQTTIAQYGTVLTNAKGFVLYTYTADRPGGPGCHGSCLVLWPPLLLSSGAAAPVAPGVTGLGTLARPEGVQVTFHGQPLYLYLDDRRPGQVAGQGVVDSGGTWFLATVTASTAPSTVTTSTVAPTTTSQPAGTLPTVAPTPGSAQPRVTLPPATPAPRPAPTQPPVTAAPTPPPPPPTSPPTTRPPAPPTTAPPGY